MRRLLLPVSPASSGQKRLLRRSCCTWRCDLRPGQTLQVQATCGSSGPVCVCEWGTGKGGDCSISSPRHSPLPPPKTLPPTPTPSAHLHVRLALVSLHQRVALQDAGRASWPGLAAGAVVQEGRAGRPHHRYAQSVHFSDGRVGQQLRGTAGHLADLVAGQLRLGDEAVRVQHGAAEVLGVGAVAGGVRNVVRVVAPLELLPINGGGRVGGWRGREAGAGGGFKIGTALLARASAGSWPAGLDRAPAPTATHKHIPCQPPPTTTHAHSPPPPHSPPPRPPPAPTLKRGVSTM